ncbi:hypothetical protein K2173_004612 [Erythroxylum novogranatense]|uniref:Late embryogenesis abundant protein LEA-2 subgroup domain-containing protein n=1 Tax=Erythroxylum novogranatense TaxID=1862640 RepID=A0AAV8T6H2_9ROSI|nr:hypothetical protein K2173_004612 [Erythroxylum novogranatense]
MPRKGLIIFCASAAILIIITAIILVVLYFTILKPREPKIYAYPATLKNFNWSFFPVPFLNFTLGIVINIDNRNYGSFKYKDSTAYVRYHSDVIGDAPITAAEIPARSKYNVSLSVTVSANEILDNQNFSNDFLSGVLTFSSSSNVQGKATALKIFKKDAKSSTNCNITVFITAQQAQSDCKSKLVIK